MEVTDKEILDLEVSPATILAEGLTEALLAETTTYMLESPLILTVVRKDGKFSKRPHIGGEVFRPKRCYVGKKGGLIYVFEPTSSTDYSFIEMSAAEVKAAFGKKFTLAVAGLITKYQLNEYEYAMRDDQAARKLAAAKAREDLKNVEKPNQYAKLGWGEF